MSSNIVQQKSIRKINNDSYDSQPLLKISSNYNTKNSFQSKNHITSQKLVVIENIVNPNEGQVTVSRNRAKIDMRLGGTIEIKKKFVNEKLL